MFLLNWYKEYLEIKSEREAKKRELNFCEACETLKLQLAISNDERKRLIDSILEKPVIDSDNIKESVLLKPIMPSRMNWNVRRQILESEDRAAAKVLRKNQDSNSPNKSIQNDPLTVASIERELGVENG